jgi:hypothetical protein
LRPIGETVVIDTPVKTDSAPQRRIDPWLVAIVVGAAVLGVLLVRGARNWALMPDELIYTELARSIAHSVIPIPRIRGEFVHIFQVGFPTLIAPIVGLMKMPDAYRWIVILNACAMATAAVPGYLLAHRISGNRLAARCAALAIVVTPWLASASKAIPDALAYVVVLWAIYAIARTATSERPSLRGDLLTLLAIFAAYLVRNQFLLLFGVWVGTIVFARALAAFSEGGLGSVPRALLGLITERPIPLVAFVVVVAMLLLWPQWIVGAYTLVVSGGSSGVADSSGSGLFGEMLAHASVVALGVAALPVALGLPWLLVGLTRSDRRVENDGAIAIFLALIAITWVATNFDMRFDTSDRVIERYIFYSAPLWIVAMAAFFTRPPKNIVAFAIPAMLAVLLLGRTHPYGLDLPLNVQLNHATSPLQVTLIGWQSVADAVGSSITGVAMILTMLLAAFAWWAVSSERTTTGIAVSYGVVIAVLLASTIYTVPKIVTTQNKVVEGEVGRQPASVRTWVDRAARGEPFAIAFSPLITVGAKRGVAPSERLMDWYDLAFWNGQFATLYLPIEGPQRAATLLPGPAYPLLPRWSDGRLVRTESDASRYLLMAESNPTFAPQFAGTPTRRNGFVLYDAGRDPRAAWATKGLTRRGWVPPQGASLRIFSPHGANGPTALRVRIDSNGAKGRTITFRSMTIGPGGHADLKLSRAAGGTHIERVTVNPQRASGLAR